MEYRDLDNNGTWVRTQCDKVFPYDKDPSKCYEAYPVFGTRIQLRITGDATIADAGTKLYHMALVPQPFAMLESGVRTPHVTLPVANTDAWQNMLLLEASPFLTAYHDYFVQTEFGLFDRATGELKRIISNRQTTYMMVDNEAQMPEPGEYLIKCRHQSDVSEWSAWSAGVPVTLHAARVLFGFAGKSKAGGFNEAVFDRLDFYPIRFGFAGARLSGGFDSVAFTTQLED